MEGMEATTDLFINLIQNNRIIYDKSLKDFKNTRKKEEAWIDIANQSRMTVDRAKKRYASLRQKYSREKRNCEVKRRYKTAVSRNWVYYERLHFLDSFIQPRSTYTNDPFVEEDDDSAMLNECGIEDTNEASGVTSKTIEIELGNGINIDELGAFSTDDTDTGFNACVPLDIPREVQNGPDHHQSDEHIWNCREQIASKYSDEQSTIEYQSFTEPRVTSRDNENDTAIGNVQQQSENGQQPDDANVMDLDNYVSPHPSTSSSIRNATIPSYPSRCYDPKCGEIVIARTVNHSKAQTPSNNHQLNDVGTSSQQSSATPKNVTASAQPSLSNQTVQSTTSSAATTIRSNPSTRRSTVVPNIVAAASTLVSATSNEKRMDAIRQRMESCLTAITKKVSDKAQKSPHGPFLSYLGTRLQSVPKESLPRLEREILDLVDQHVS